MVWCGSRYSRDLVNSNYLTDFNRTGLIDVTVMSLESSGRYKGKSLFNHMVSTSSDANQIKQFFHTTSTTLFKNLPTKLTMSQLQIILIERTGSLD